MAQSRSQLARFSTLAGLSLAAVFAAACDSGTGPPAPGGTKPDTTVVTPSRDSVVVTFDYNRIEPGDTVRFRARVLRGGTVIDTGRVEWFSGDTAVAIVDATGLVTGRRFGAVTVTARSGSAATASPLTVVNVAAVTCGSPPGRVTQGVFDSAQVWRRADGPIQVPKDYVASTLRVEPGTLICSGPGVHISAVLTAEGTPSQPIVFSALVPGQPWGGLAGGPQHLRYALVEYAAIGVLGPSGADISDSHFRQDGLAVYLNQGVLRNSVVDSCGGVSSVIMSGTFQDDTIRGGGAASLGYPIRVLGGRIIGTNASAALRIVGDRQVVEGRPIRITGAASYPAEVGVDDLLRIWPTAADQDSLRGNARDTLLIRGTLSGEAVVRTGLPWRMNGEGITVSAGATLRVEPGSGITGPGSNNSGGEMVVRGRLVATGTADAPVALKSMLLTLRGVQPAGSILSDARLENVTLYSLESHPVRLQRVTAVGGSCSYAPNCVNAFTLGSSGSRISDSQITGGGSASGLPALILAGDSIIVERSSVRSSLSHGIVTQGNNLLITQCEISNNRGDGIQVASLVRINDCNIEHNTGVGVSNTAPAAVDATRNWWGDPSGPLGPMGDGVSGNVQFNPLRIQPVVIPTLSLPQTMH